jgi:hypothetical protein
MSAIRSAALFLAHAHQPIHASEDPAPLGHSTLRQAGLPTTLKSLRPAGQQGGEEKKRGTP